MTACGLALVLGAGAGCVPQQPGGSDWRDQAVQTLQDVGSGLATAELVLRLQRDHRLVGHYGVVSLVHAEESAGKAVQGFTALQPPDGARDLDRRVNALLASATDLIRSARVSLTAGSAVPSRLLAALGAAADRLAGAATRLERGR